MIFEVQLVVPDRHVRALGQGLFEALEKGARGAGCRARKARQVLQAAERLEHVDGRTAAAVAPAVCHEHLVVKRAVLEPGPGAACGARHRIAVVGRSLAAFARHAQEVRQHVAPVWAPPAEGVVRDPVRLAPAEFVGDEVRQVGSGHERRQGPGEAERVRQPDHLRVDPELAFEVARSDQKLARQRLTIWQVAVGLHPHAAERLPATLLHPLANALEGGRVVFFDHCVLQRRRRQEAVLGVALHQPQDGGPRATRLLPRLDDRPQPGAVDVRMSDGYQRWFIRGGVKLSQPVGNERVSGVQTAPKVLAAWAAPVDGQQRVFGELFQAWPRGVVGLERLQGVVQHAQVVVRAHRRGVDAHQAEDRCGLPFEISRARPDFRRELVVRPGRQIGEAVVLVEPVVRLPVEIQQALHTLLGQAPRAQALLDGLGPKALGDQRGLVGRPVGRTAQSKTQPPNRVRRLAPVAAQDRRGGIVEVGPGG